MAPPGFFIFANVAVFYLELAEPVFLREKVASENYIHVVMQLKIRKISHFSNPGINHNLNLKLLSARIFDYMYRVD